MDDTVNASRWAQIEKVYHAALERPAESRSSYLVGACGGDAELLREVESLLAQEGTTPLDRPAWELAEPADQPLANGTKLGPYEITGILGQGGMGRVYSARDHRLGRPVAIKFGTGDFGERFRQEARAVAALNHPNVCTLHDVGPNYLVMELVEGDTLGERIRKGPVPLAEALGIARQIAEALEAAHEQGIVHRDLKPANVKVKPDGSVKVIDFGLAKAQISPGNPEDSPTVTMTQPGTIMGTAAYMAPEQARGELVDRRADIWAFGVVLYEMLTAKRPFAGQTVADIIAGILQSEPDWSVLPAAPISRLVRRCLVKDKRQRLQAIGDARIAIDENVAEPPAVAQETATPQRKPWLFTAAAFLALAAFAIFHFTQRPPEARIVKLSLTPPEKLSFSDLTISPDGFQVAFTAIGPSGKPQLWVRRLDALTAQPLANTEDASSPFWSPDSRFLAFFDGKKLRKVPAEGGTPLAICDAKPGFGGTWNQAGVILFSSGFRRGLAHVSADGGEPQPATNFTPSGDVTQSLPQFLPDGRRFLFTSTGEGLTPPGVYSGSLDSRQVGRILPLQSGVRYVASSGGYVLYVREGTLLAHPFDEANLQLTGAPVPIAEHLAPINSLQARASFTVSTTGVLAFVPGDGLNESQLTLVDRAGKRLSVVGDPGEYSPPSFSPDEKQIVVARRDPAVGHTDLWIIELARNLSTRFTSHPQDEHNPVWSPDGRRIAFNSNRSGPFNTFIKAVNATDDGELLVESSRSNGPADWSGDGRFLLYNADALWALPMSGKGKAFPAAPSEFYQFSGKFSPDGKWVAYSGNDSATMETYVQPFPPTGAKFRISTNGGTYPCWRGDGRELFLIDRELRVTAVPITLGATVNVGDARPLFKVARAGRLAVTRDGQRFLVTVPLRDSSGTSAVVILNWTAVIK